MWDSLTLPLAGNFSLRQIVRSFLAVLVSAFLLTIINSSVTHAADATWQDDGSIKYNDKTYVQESPVPAGIDAPEGAAVFIAKDEQQGTASVLTIPKDSDLTKELKNVTVREYTLGQDGSYANPRGPTTISLAAKPAAKNKTQCDVAGVGWIICSSSRFIAEGMDKIFDIIANFLVVKPISTDKNSGLYQAWSVALSIANMMFILAFLVVIYSHITSYGIDNYNIKKMIPKLIVAAVLVNISYYVCSMAVDVSNILGYSVQEALISIRKSLPDPVSQISWSNLTTYVLSGGTIGAVFVGGLVGLSASGGVSGLAFMLFPILVAGALAVLVALLILAARQALIVVLIVVAPLAFVAYLLPNTEKWFEKWRDLFMTMLLVFPLFSLLFGGSQLASYIVIQNTDQISVVIFAMFIQVAPLVMTPFLVKFSGSLLGRLAGMVDNPRKGLVDRARNWSQPRTDLRKAAMSSKGANTRFGPSRMAYRRDMKRRNREGLKAMYENETDAAWHNDARYHAIHKRNKTADIIKNVGESNGDTAFERYKASNPTLQQYVGQQRLNQDQIKRFQTEEEARWEEAKSANMTAGNQFAQYSGEARASLQAQNIAQSNVAMAQAMQKIEYANDMIKSEALQAAAGGIADHGAQRALASAVSEYRKDYNDRISEATAILKHYNLSGVQRQDHALGKTIEVFDERGNMKILRKDSLFTREAAIETQLSTGTYKEIEEIISRSGGELNDFKTTIAAAIASNKLSSKAVFLGGKTIDDTGQGKIMTQEHLMRAVTSTIAKGKISASDLATNENTALIRIFEAARDKDQYRGYLNAEENAALDANIEALKRTAEQALTHPTISQSLRENARAVLEQIRNLP